MILVDTVRGGASSAAIALAALQGLGLVVRLVDVCEFAGE